MKGRLRRVFLFLLQSEQACVIKNWLLKVQTGVEVRVLAGNFDTLRKDLFVRFWEAKPNFLFWQFLGPDFT